MQIWRKIRKKNREGENSEHLMHPAQGNDLLYVKSYVYVAI